MMASALSVSQHSYKGTLYQIHMVLLCYIVFCFHALGFPPRWRYECEH